MCDPYNRWVGETDVGGVPELTGQTCLEAGFAQPPQQRKKETIPKLQVINSQSPRRELKKQKYTREESRSNDPLFMDWDPRLPSPRNGKRARVGESTVDSRSL